MGDYDATKPRLPFTDSAVSSFINHELYLLVNETTDSRPVLRRLEMLLDRRITMRWASKEDVDGLLKVEKLVKEHEESTDELSKNLESHLEQSNRYILKPLFAIIVFTCLWFHRPVYERWDRAIGRFKVGTLSFCLDFLCNTLSGVFLMVLIFLADFFPKHFAEKERALQEKRKKAYGIVAEEKKPEHVEPVEMKLYVLVQRQKDVIKHMMEVVEPKRQELARLTRQFHLNDLVHYSFYVSYLAARMFISYRAVWQLCTVWDSTNAAVFTSIMIDAWSGFQRARQNFCVSTNMATERFVNGKRTLEF